MKVFSISSNTLYNSIVRQMILRILEGPAIFYTRVGVGSTFRTESRRKFIGIGAISPVSRFPGQSRPKVANLIHNLRSPLN